MWLMNFGYVDNWDLIILLCHLSIFICEFSINTLDTGWALIFGCQLATGFPSNLLKTAHASLLFFLISKDSTVSIHFCFLALSSDAKKDSPSSMFGICLHSVKRFSNCSSHPDTQVFLYPLRMFFFNVDNIDKINFKLQVSSLS